jgi:polyprenyl-phospho-N-acetylgalactosaminyl synthase
MNNQHLFVVIPAFNEELVLGAVLDDLVSILPKRQIIVVDDGSVDGTGCVADRKGVITLRHLVNCGQGAAIGTGIAFARGLGANVIVTFDADGQHQASDIQDIIQPILQGEADVVLGSRFLGHKPEGMGLTRHIVLKLGTLFTRVVSGIKVSDSHNGLKAFSRHAAEVIQINHNRMAHASEILHEISRNRLSYVERPVTVRYTEYSLAKGQKSSDALRLGVKFLISRLMK